MDGSKSKGKKVGFAAVFLSSKRKGSLLKEASICTTALIVMKKVQKDVYDKDNNGV